MKRCPIANDMDIWECANCSYSDRGSVFNVKEIKK